PTRWPRGTSVPILRERGSRASQNLSSKESQKGNETHARVGASRSMTNYKAHKLGSLFASVVLAGSLLAAGAEASSGSSAVKLDRQAPIHPLLQYAAQVQPDKKVQVLVRKDRASSDSRAIAQGVGGSVLEEFRSARTFSMVLPIKAVTNLARNSHVQYVAPDATMRLEQINT